IFQSECLRKFSRTHAVDRRGRLDERWMARRHRHPVTRRDVAGTGAPVVLAACREKHGVAFLSGQRGHAAAVVSRWRHFHFEISFLEPAAAVRLAGSDLAARAKTGPRAFGSVTPRIPRPTDPAADEPEGFCHGVILFRNAYEHWSLVGAIRSLPL